MKWVIAFLFGLISLGDGLAQDNDSLIKKSIYFGGGSYYIDEQQQLELKEFIETLDNLEQYKIVLFSHTDNIGGKEYNQWLSNMRSIAVLKEILANGIPEEKTETKNFGLNNPLYTNTSNNGRIMNRRVDVILVPIIM